jgi:hypothetical protein
MSALDQLLDDAVARIGESTPLHAVALEPELAKPKSFLKVLDADHYNWEADRFRKLFAMRFRVKLPPLDQINMIFYPEPTYDAPIFLFFCLLTKRKVIGHLNVNCPFDDAEYRARWVEPLDRVLGQYPPFEAADRYPEWMQKYRRDCTIMGMFKQDRFEDLSACALAYVDHYVRMVEDSEPVSDPVRLAQIRAFHETFVSDIRTQDKAQGMISKMIGKEPARRIFYEVTT